MIQCIHNMTRLFCIHLFTCIVINNSGLPPIETVETILAFLSCCLGESCMLGVSQPKNYCRPMMAGNISALRGSVLWVFFLPNSDFPC